MRGDDLPSGGEEAILFMDMSGRQEAAAISPAGRAAVNTRTVCHLLYGCGAFVLFPLCFYLVVFCGYTYPLIHRFSTHFFADQGDGLQNVWNLWWVDKAVRELHQLPWHTAYLHYPTGVSLLGSTLNPFNGFVGTALSPLLTLVEIHNGIVMGSFVLGGVTAFWLAYHLTGSYWGSILGGFIFTFSNYHFAHAQGHLQLVSLEWIPLFVLCWYLLMSRPSTPRAVASAAALVAVVLCDYYYFLYCVALGFLLLVWYGREQGDYLFFLKGKHLIPFGVFGALVLLTAGPLVFSLLSLNERDPLVGFHSPVKCSLDLLAPVIPGGHWYFAPLTEPFWSQLTVNIHESSVHMGISVLFLLIAVWVKRGECRMASLRFWYGALLIFWVLSLGPVLHIWGREVPFMSLPYGLLENVFTPLKLSGAPVRMMVMVMLCSAVISAVGCTLLFRTSPGKRWMALPLLVLLVVEYLPRPMPASQPVVPPYVQVVQGLPGDGGVLDLVSIPTRALYYQTIHQKPVAFGYVARIPTSARDQERTIRQLARDKDYGTLACGYRFKYLITPADAGDTGDELPRGLLYQDGTTAVYDLEASFSCFPDR